MIVSDVDPLDLPPIRLERPADKIVADLRAVLAPLLDDPYEQHGEADDEYDSIVHRCRFCEAEAVWKRAWTGRLDARGRKINEDVDATPHKSDCAVLRKDELLGR